MVIDDVTVHGIGDERSNWNQYGVTDGMDKSDRILVLGNVIGPDVRAEHIDVKEGTRDGVISGNTFIGQGITGQNSADSWVDVKGNYNVVDNTNTVTGETRRLTNIDYRLR